MDHKDSEKPDEPVFVFINVLFHFTIAFYEGWLDPRYL